MPDPNTDGLESHLFTFFPPPVGVNSGLEQKVKRWMKSRLSVPSFKVTAVPLGSYITKTIELTFCFATTVDDHIRPEGWNNSAKKSIGRDGTNCKVDKNDDREREKGRTNLLGLCITFHSYLIGRRLDCCSGWYPPSSPALYPTLLTLDCRNDVHDDRKYRELSVILPDSLGSNLMLAANHSRRSCPAALPTAQRHRSHTYVLDGLE